MAFRADEETRNGFERVKNYLIPRNIAAKERERSEKKLLEIIKEYGPAVESYPSWHALIFNHNDDSCPAMAPDERCGYKGLDHTQYFRNAFITCPYVNGQNVIDSVEHLKSHHAFTITAEPLDVQFYSPQATPILVYCEWKDSIATNQMIPASLAIPLMLEKELPCWEWSQYGESWERMRPYFLGTPHGSRSSLFVDQETAMTMKKVWELLIQTKMFGRVRD